MSRQTLYWYDYETFGIDPRRDRLAQFAGIRTDAELNIIDDSLVLYCKPANDTLPQPEACLITGITPQKALKEGVCEADFIAAINREFSRPNTCVVGYNNIRFDDEFTRNTLYRNFFDPYAREWQSGNSRWDLIDMVRLTCALRPSGIHWPSDETGRPSFRLDQLSIANGIEHGHAHDALADVVATIEVAKLIKIHQPKLYDFVFRNRGKYQAGRSLDITAMHPLLHVSGQYSAEKRCIAVVAPVAKHPINKNAIIVYDLSKNADPLIKLNIEDIRHRVFTPHKQLPEGLERLPLKNIHINRCPVIVPIKALRNEDAVRLSIDLKLCRENLEKIRNESDLPEKIQEVFADSGSSKESDPDVMLYSGGFFSDHDKSIMEEVRSAVPDDLRKLKPNFQDKRLPEMLFRYVARNFPESLSDEQCKRWDCYRYSRLTQDDYGASIVIEEYREQLKELRRSVSSKEKLAIVDELEEYGNTLLAELRDSAV